MVVVLRHHDRAHPPEIVAMKMKEWISSDWIGMKMMSGKIVSCANQSRKDGHQPWRFRYSCKSYPQAWFESRVIRPRATTWMHTLTPRPATGEGELILSMIATNPPRQGDRRGWNAARRTK
jgi:hypothetical protein